MSSEPDDLAELLDRVEQLHGPTERYATEVAARAARAEAEFVREVIARIDRVALLVATAICDTAGRRDIADRLQPALDEAWREEGGE